MLLQENKGIHAFCLRCRERIPIHDPTFFKLKNGRRSIRGSCPLFSGKVSRIVGKNAVKQMLGEKSGVGAFCLRCKERITVDDPSLFKLKNGRRSIRGSCPLCKGKVSRIVGKKVFEEMLASHESEYHAYCLRCKEKVPVKKPAFPTLKNGRHSVRGFCPLCDGKVSRILKKVEEAILVERMEEEHPIEPEVPEETVVEEEHLDDKIEVPPWSDIRKDISSAYCFRCGKELSDSETINDPSGKGDETARAFCIDCLEYVYQYLDPSVGLNKTIRAYVKKKRRQSIKTEDTPENPEMEYIQKASKYEWRVTTVETNVPSPDTESEVEEESQPKLLDSSTLPLIDYDKKEYQSSMESEEESLGVESEESEGSDQEVRETIDALLKDLKDKKRQDTVSEEKIEESEFEQNIKKEKMIREILPLYEKERISRDLEKYGRFSLIMPFRGFSDQEPVEEEIPPELEPVEEEAEPPVVEEEAPVLELIREEIEEPPVVEEEAETTEEERISLNEILDEMLEGTDETGEDVEELEHLDRIHGTSTSHEEIVIRQCRSCERNFCLECANMAKTEIGYHNIPEETFSEYFEPLCIHCWEKFQVRFEEAQVPEEEVRSAPVEMPDDTDELDETPYDDWTRTGTKTNERVRTVEDKKDRRKKMRERIELLRRIRDIRWKVSSPEEPKVEKVVSVEVQEVEPEEKEDEYIEPHDGRPSSKLVNSIGMRLNLISPGSFIMGSKRWSESQPVRRVNIRRPFYISIFPVTQKEWKSVLGNNPSYPKGDYLPVVNVSWNDCHKFIMKLNALEGSLRYRLPTEAEWEFAARAGSTGRYSFGDDVSKLPLYAWLGEDWDVGELHPVGLKRSNEWGLYDVHGNIWEWCQDNWHPNFNGAPADGRAWEGGGDVNRVRRGGTWTHDPEHCETAHRNRNGAGYRYKYLGFRIVRSI
jgi:formylglycine-generating enzyme required for sulfatase activity